MNSSIFRRSVRPSRACVAWASARTWSITLVRRARRAATAAVEAAGSVPENIWSKSTDGSMIRGRAIPPLQEMFLAKSQDTGGAGGRRPPVGHVERQLPAVGAKGLALGDGRHELRPGAGSIQGIGQFADVEAGVRGVEAVADRIGQKHLGHATRERGSGPQMASQVRNAADGGPVGLGDRDIDGVTPLVPTRLTRTS
jgi:hypothetical protein